MKKKTLLLALTLFLVTACGSGSSDPKPQKKDFTGITFASDTVTYDGNPHTLSVSGAPEFAQVTYMGKDNYTDVGTYPMSAKITAEDYNDLTLNATLTINPKEFTGITFASQSVTYDGNSHTLVAEGIPAFATATYTGKGDYTNAGTYPMSVKVTAKNYKDLTLSATLTIAKATLTGVTFDSQTFEYDGNPHSIQIGGVIPENATVTYSSDVEGVTNTATEIGVYNITAVVKDKNFNDLTLKATLTIKVKDTERYLLATGNSLYFQNAKDDNKLYRYDYQNFSLKKVNNDNAIDMINNGSDSIMYVSSSILLSSIKSASYESESVNVANVYTAYARYIQKDASGNIYYVVNGLTNAKSGIYKVDVSGEEATVTKLSEGKAYYLTLYNNNLYFADGANDKILSKISVNGENQTRTAIIQDKIKNLYLKNGSLFYTVNRSLGDFIQRYDINNQAIRKVTSDAGIDLTVIGDYVYYIQADFATSAILGKGIYKALAFNATDNSLPGTKVIENSENGLCSLTAAGNNLVYYDCDGYKLVEANTSGQFIKDYLQDFVKPADPTPTNTGSEIKTYNNQIYYLDIWDEKTLHRYNPTTKTNVRLSSDKVAHFSIIGDYVYMNTVSKVVDNNTYRVNLKVGGEPELVNKYDAKDFQTDGTYLYYVECNALGVATAIHKSDMDGQNDSIIYTKGVSNLKINQNKILFVDGSNIHAMNLDGTGDATVKVSGREIHTTVFDTDGTYLYYRDMYGIGYASKRLARCKLDGTDDVKIVDNSKTDPVAITVIEGKVYYYCDTTKAAQNGLFKVNTNVTEATEPTLVLACNSTYYSETFTILSSVFYFVNTYNFKFGDAHLYSLIEGEQPTKLA